VTTTSELLGLNQPHR